MGPPTSQAELQHQQGPTESPHVEFEMPQSPNKQQYLDWLISEQRPDVVMFNETKLTSPLFLAGYYSH